MGQKDKKQKKEKKKMKKEKNEKKKKKEKNKKSSSSSSSSSSSEEKTRELSPASLCKKAAADAAREAELAASKRRKIQDAERRIDGKEPLLPAAPKRATGGLRADRADPTMKDQVGQWNEVKEEEEFTSARERKEEEKARGKEEKRKKKEEERKKKPIPTKLVTFKVDRAFRDGRRPCGIELDGRLVVDLADKAPAIREGVQIGWQLLEAAGQQFDEEVDTGVVVKVLRAEEDRAAFAKDEKDRSFTVKFGTDEPEHWQKAFSSLKGKH